MKRIMIYLFLGPLVAALTVFGTASLAYGTSPFALHRVLGSYPLAFLFALPVTLLTGVVDELLASRVPLALRAIICLTVGGAAVFAVFLFPLEGSGVRGIELLGIAGPVAGFVCCLAASWASATRATT